MNKKRYQSIMIFCLSTFALTLGGCGGGSSTGGSIDAVAPPVVRPTTPPVIRAGISQDATYDATSVTDLGVSTTGAAVSITSYADDGTIKRIEITTPYSSVIWDEASGDIIDDSMEVVAAENASGSNIGVVVNAANPKVGWKYQTFGIWGTGLDTGSGNIGAITVGEPTLASNIPDSGTVTFFGISGGIYLDPAGTDYITASVLSANVDFSNRSIGLATALTSKVDFAGNTTVATNLDMTGTLTYGAVNSFTGVVNTTGGLSGTSTGQFYGPTAEELGGIFSLTGAGATYAGAYGAKQ